MAMRKTLFLLLLCILITGCASKGSNDSEQIIEESEEIFLFSDWQYRGFGQEYPLWAESALKNDIQSLIEFFPELEGKESQIEITVQFGKNVDMLTNHETVKNDVLPEEEVLEDLDAPETLPAAKVYAETWVYINPDYNEYEDNYAYIKIGGTK